MTSTNTIAGATIQEYHARAEGQDLVLDIRPLAIAPFRGIEIFPADGDLYFSLCYDSILGYPTISQRHTRHFFPTNGTNGLYQFRIDARHYQLGTNWTSHLYWIVDDSCYLIWESGYWSAKKRGPIGRLPIVVTQ